jgi:hypothetical protein
MPHSSFRRHVPQIRRQVQVAEPLDPHQGEGENVTSNDRSAEKTGGRPSPQPPFAAFLP